MAVVAITDIRTIEILHSQRKLWQSGRLAPEWARKFPELFDEEDVRLVESQGKYGWHFVEWLAAIVLYHATGYHSLIPNTSSRSIGGNRRSWRSCSLAMCCERFATVRRMVTFKVLTFLSTPRICRIGSSARLKGREIVYGPSRSGNSRPSRW